MIPEFIDATAAIQSHLHQKMVKAHKESTAIFKRSRKIIYHEGEHFGSKEGSKVELSELTRVESGMELHASDLVGMTPKDFEERFAKMGKEIGEKATHYHWKVVFDATDRHGTIIERQRGEPVVESIFKMIEAVHMAFEIGGSGYAFYVPPSKYDEVAAALDEIKTNPALSNRMTQLMQHKYEQWRAEEADRKLVD